MSNAMKVASKLYPRYNSLSKLSTLNHIDMTGLGLHDEEIRQGIMDLCGKGKGKGKGAATKRKFTSDMDRPLPDREVGEVVLTDLDFEEILYEETLIHKSVIVNRAPVMSAWCCVVAERLGFARQEALSIAQVYTELNATSKGVSLGIYDAEKLKPGAGSAQPFVDIMGRKIPVLSMQDGQWRAISAGEIVKPQTAFAYHKRSFHQQLGAVIGSLRLLAESYPPDELNEKGYGMYLNFRPETDGWGKKAEMKMSTILDLRKATVEPEQEQEGNPGQVKVEETTKSEVKEEDPKVQEDIAEVRSEEPPTKRPKLEKEASPNPYDLAFDDDDFDFDAIP